MLEPRPDWPADVAQRLIGEALQRTLERYARSALAAVGPVAGQPGAAGLGLD